MACTIGDDDLSCVPSAVGQEILSMIVIAKAIKLAVIADAAFSVSLAGKS
jgi:hypothetical protein